VQQAKRLTALTRDAICDIGKHGLAHHGFPVNPFYGTYDSEPASVIPLSEFLMTTIPRPEW